MTDRPTAHQIQEMLGYDPNTGVLTWKIRPSQCTKVGDVAGTVNSKGYVAVSVKRRNYKAHVLAVVIMTGEWPKAGVVIDHEDHVTTNNRWLNLRPVTKAKNGQNHSGPQSNSTTGVRGVFFRAGRRLPWSGGIRLNGRLRNKGFKTKEEAEEWVVSKRIELHPLSPESAACGGVQ